MALTSAFLFGLFALGPRTSSGHDDETAKLFRSQCVTCHGADGKGQTTIGKQLGMKDWKDGKTLKALTDDQIRKTIREGIKGSDGKERMPPFKKLTDGQVGALIRHVRSFQ
jgi:mono/diheme cytochrome c family protein